MTGTLVVCSGGMDSVTLAHACAAEGSVTRLLTFDYGQRHKKEIAFAKRAADRLGVPHDVMDITSVTRFLTGSALTDPDHVDVPDGHYAEDSMKQTVVPNRNAIFLALAFGVASAEGASAVAAAVHAGDHFIYPDCRPEFVDAFQVMQDRALEGMWEVKLHTPYVTRTKAEIVKIGADLGVPFEETWSCYKGGDIHCGRCGTCVERAEAFRDAGVDDPTEYEDPDFWKTVV